MLLLEIHYFRGAITFGILQYVGWIFGLAKELSYGNLSHFSYVRISLFFEGSLKIVLYQHLKIENHQRDNKPQRNKDGED